MPSIVSVRNLTKTYKSGFHALKSINLEIEEGEIPPVVTALVVHGRTSTNRVIVEN